MFLVGLTGGIATGKSTVSRILSQDLGCPIIDADQIAREVVEPGTRGWKKIKDTFGNSVFLDNGKLDREKMGSIIFSNVDKRKALNAIVHPEIYRSMIWKLIKLFVTGHQFAVLDLPLFFETGNVAPYTTFVLVVSCTEDQQLERLMARNNLSKQDAENRIKAQMPLAEKCKRATHVIDNSGDLNSTEKQVKDIYNRIRCCKLHWKIRILLFVAVCNVSAVVYFFLQRSGFIS